LLLRRFLAAQAQQQPTDTYISRIIMQLQQSVKRTAMAAYSTRAGPATQAQKSRSACAAACIGHTQSQHCSCVLYLQGLADMRKTPDVISPNMTSGAVVHASNASWRSVAQRYLHMQHNKQKPQQQAQPSNHIVQLKRCSGCDSARQG
jgi:hypothetical protein